MTIADGVNKNANHFMTGFSEYIEYIFDTIERYQVQLNEVQLGSNYVPEKYELPVTRMIEASIEPADIFAKLDQKRFDSDSVIYTEVYTDLSIEDEREREYIFKFRCNGAIISVKTRFIICSIVQMYFGIKHPSSDKSIVPQDTIRFSIYFTLNTKFEECSLNIENLIWTSLMLKDIEVLNDLMMFVPESRKLITAVASTMLNIADDRMCSIKIRVHETIEKLRNQFSMSNHLNRCICGYDDEDDQQ